MSALRDLATTDEETHGARVIAAIGQEDHVESELRDATGDDKRAVLREFARVDATLSSRGGLVDYITCAKKLLENSKNNVSSLHGVVPEPPTDGVHFKYDSTEYRDADSFGLDLMKKTAFVLVAGGLGERLGYNGIKLSLPLETVGWTCYLEHYCKWIYDLAGPDAPFVIMTSGDTHDMTVKLIEKLTCDKPKITLVKQEQVPCLGNNSAHVAFRTANGKKSLMFKPHGHGDVHSLLFAAGIHREWIACGREYALFFQDTNTAVTYNVPASLAYMAKAKLSMVSITVPRTPGESAGGLALIPVDWTDPKKGKRMVNIEYNVLGGLIPGGDVAPSPGANSLYPGNCNNLVFNVAQYSEVLDRSRGVVPEFVNPKYADATRESFKSPTRLESLMQDFALLLDPHHQGHGYACFEKVFYTPVKNKTADGVKLHERGIDPATPGSGEERQYEYGRIMVRRMGGTVANGGASTFDGLNLQLLPAISFDARFQNILSLSGDKYNSDAWTGTHISGRSVLLVIGGGRVEISKTPNALDLDGCLVIRFKGANQVLKIESLVLRNKGWRPVPYTGEEEVLRMRGFTYDQLESRVIELEKDGETMVINETAANLEAKI